MYIHAGNGRLIRSRGIVGIFDLDSSTMSQATRELLRSAEREGRMESVGDDLPRSFIVTEDGFVYVTRLSASTLVSRLENGFEQP